MPQKQLASGEHVILHLRTHVKALFAPLILTLLLVAAAVTGAVFVPEGSAKTWIWLTIAVLLLVVLVWVLVLPVARWWTTTYTVTNRRLVTRKGVLTRTGHDIPLARVNDVQIEKSLLDRMMGCGTLIVADASENAGVRLHDVPRVDSVQVAINEQLHAAGEGGSSRSSAPDQPRSDDSY